MIKSPREGDDHNQVTTYKNTKNGDNNDPEQLQEHKRM